MPDQNPQETEPLIPEDLSEHSLEDLRAMHEELSSQYDGADQETLAGLAQRRDLRMALNTLATAINELQAGLDDSEEVVEIGDPTPDTPEELIDGDLAPATEEPVAADAGDESEAEATEPEPALAAAQAEDVTTGEGDTTSSEDPSEDTPAPFLASAGQSDYHGGTEIDMEDLRQLVNSQMAMSRGDGGEFQRQARLASIDRHKDEIPKMGRDAAENTRILAELRAPTHEESQHVAHTAALCGPKEIIRPIPACVASTRKVANLFPRVQSTYGAFQWFEAVSLADAITNVEQWTDAKQGTVDETNRATWKQCMDLACPTGEITAQIDPIYHCLTVDVLKEFSAPEQLDSTLNALAGAHARIADGALLEKIKSFCISYSHDPAVSLFGASEQGALVTLIDGLGATLASAGFGGRLDLDESDYVAIIPQPLERLLFVEAFRQGAEHGGVEARNAIAEAFAGLGIRFETVLDQAVDTANAVTDPALYTTALPAVGDAEQAIWGAAGIGPSRIPLNWQVHLIDPNDGFFFEKPEINMGFERSPELARQNKSQMFFETFEGLGKQGCSPWFTIDFSLCFEGGRTGTTAPDCGIIV